MRDYVHNQIKLNVSHDEQLALGELKGRLKVWRDQKSNQKL